ncbi:Cytochrome c oxidase subunit 5A, mitochondrial-like [Oopsacas minuta]|uniref:Cytochrome c oxidase subunit 5A, mitochondrial n=1 Tax=Oopsacas minuta TaxID=111878 RepID=A0AAV7K6F8_9METZ|nr:Cytochrome c oxidase subunit 5A, mitochondrial-like [Oopsacas minuta]
MAVRLLRPIITAPQGVSLWRPIISIPAQTRQYTIRGKSATTFQRAFSEVSTDKPLSATSGDTKLTQEQKDEIMDQEWVDYFNQSDIDKWLLRNGYNKLYGLDMVPEPKILVSVLNACRRLSDFPSAIRVLESVKLKAGGNPEIYDYVIQELKPTLTELGIPTPEELGVA